MLNTLVYKKEQTERLKKFDDKRSGWESRWSIAHRIGGYHSHLLYNTAEAAQWYWERYEYTKDLNWLREKAYPMLKGTAELYRTHPLTKKEADGKYHTNNLGWAETFWGGPKFFQKLFVFAHSPMVAPTTGVPGSYIPVPALTQHSHSRQDYG